MGKKKMNTMDLHAGGEVTFKYKFLEDYHPEYVSGMFGSGTPRNEVVLNFFFERPGLPKKQTLKITEEGQLGEEVSSKRLPKDLNQSFVRQVKSGIIMSMDTATELRNFLNKILEPAEEKEGSK